MKMESYSINFDEGNWRFALDNVHKDIKINYSQKEAFSYNSNYIKDNIKIIKEEKIEHITRRST